MTTIKLKKSQVRQILQMTFPEYRGRKYKIEFRDTVTFYDTNWSGGTRNTYRFVRADGKVADLPVAAPWANPAERLTVEVPPDVLVVRHSFFCGQDMGITITAHPCHLPRWLGCSENGGGK